MDTLTIARVEVFLSKIDRSDKCWEWRGGSTSEGYGQFAWKQRPILAHRLSFWLLRGSLTKGLVIDHLCRNRLCVNPDHLEEVTSSENIKRGKGIYVLNSAKTRCKNGHLFDSANTYHRPDGKGRECRLCRKLTLDKYHLKRKGV